MKDLYAIKIRAIWAELRNERASFLLVCAYLFLEYVRPQSIYPQIDVMPYALVTVLLTLIAYFSQSERPQVKNFENKLLGFYLVTVLLSSIFAYAPSVAFENLQAFLAWIVVYYLITHIVNTEKR